jgi:hypothetical protein
MAAAREVDEPMVNPEDSPEATLAAPSVPTLRRVSPGNNAYIGAIMAQWRPHGEQFGAWHQKLRTRQSNPSTVSI